jgi:anthranilate synthase component 2
MLLLIDNYDSFTYNLKDYFEQLGEECTVVRNDELTIDEIEKLTFDKIVLSPGPERPEKAGILNAVIERFYTRHPILGICLGHQALGEFFGMQLVKAKYPMHGKISIIKHNGDEVFDAMPKQFEVCRYHSLVLVQSQQSTIKAIATTNEGEIMAIKHSTLPIYGVQFHPEAILTQHGIPFLRNWLVTVATKTLEFE